MQSACIVIVWLRVLLVGCVYCYSLAVCIVGWPCIIVVGWPCVIFVDWPCVLFLVSSAYCCWLNMRIVVGWPCVIVVGWPV